MWINSADDFINPPELGIAEREAKRLKNGRFVLIPIQHQTHGHGTHTWAAVWQQYLAELLECDRFPVGSGASTHERPRHAHRVHQSRHRPNARTL